METMNNRTVEITVEELKSFIEAKVLLQNAERILRRSDKTYMEREEVMDILGIEV